MSAGWRSDPEASPSSDPGDDGRGRRPGSVGGPVLGVESSCDECSAGVVMDGRLLGHVIATQDVHGAYGGVVPEIAAREQLRAVDAVVRDALREAEVEPPDLGGVGVTAGPGLIGSLLVGVNWAKAFAFALDLPLLGVHHMEAHLFANSVDRPEAEPPFVALLVSGGHTLLLHARSWGDYELLGETRDDAAGEAFDKVARRLGLGYPGGPEIERRATDGRPGVYSLPRPMLSDSDGPGDASYFDFSFSGLKTAVSLLVREIEEGDGPGVEEAVPDVAAEFQAAVVDVLTRKTLRAVETTGCRRVLVGGGVARNGALRRRLEAEMAPGGDLFVPPPRLATDNGAMVARAAEHRLSLGERSGLDLDADASMPFPGLARRSAEQPARAG